MVPIAVLFDFDGVIADAENYHIAAWQRTLARLGWEIPDDVAARSAAIDDHVFAAELFAKREIPDADLDGWVSKKQALTLEMIRHSPRLYTGAADLIRELARRTRLAVVANTSRKNVEALLERTGLADQFELIIGKEDVSAGPPAPDSYLLALERLKITAEQAFAIEGSPEGLSAARAAGVRCMAVGHRRPFGEWAGDALFVSDFEPVSGILTQLGFADENLGVSDRKKS